MTLAGLPTNLSKDTRKAGFSPRPLLDQESGLLIVPAELAAAFLDSSGRDGHPGGDGSQCHFLPLAQIRAKAAMSGERTSQSSDL